MKRIIFLDKSRILVLNGKKHVYGDSIVIHGDYSQVTSDKDTYIETKSPVTIKSAGVEICHWN